MCPRRREVLAALGGIGFVGGGYAYWNRRRIRRRDEISDYEAALDIGVPEVATAVQVSDSHLEASYAWAREHVEGTADVVGDDSPGWVVDRLEEAREGLERLSPEESSEDGPALLDGYYLAVARSATVRGWHYEEDDDGPSEELREAHAELGAAVEAFEPSYQGGSPSEAVVQAAEAEDLAARAHRRYGRADGRMQDDEFANSIIWETLEVSRLHIHDAAWFVRELEGEGHREALEAAYDRFQARIEDAVDGIQVEYDDDVITHAAARWSDAVRPVWGTDPEDHLEAGRLGLAVREQARRATVAATLAAFEDVPAGRGPSRHEVEVVDDTAAVVEAKERAVDGIGTAVDEVGDDPLARYLLERPQNRVERGDRQLERLVGDARSADSQEWQLGGDRVYLGYREAAEDAAAVPGVVRELEA